MTPKELFNKMHPQDGDLPKWAEDLMELYAKEQYNEGINDCYKANEKANILLAGLREKSKYNEAYNQAIRDAAENAEIKEIINNGRPPKFIINKDSILQLLK